MARPVMLGNGALTVGLNEHGLVHDFYYPYVGLDNLTTARSVHHKIGVWVDGKFSWVDDGAWNIDVNFEADALVSNIVMKNSSLEIELHLTDFVDAEYNAFCRVVKVKNQAAQRRQVKVFMHQVFQISRGGRADTALFVPDENYILDYKGRCCLLIYGQDESGQLYDQFAIGNYGIEGKEGTYKDAEDGELSGSAVEHGGVDSVIRFMCDLGAKGHNELHYWIIAADSQFSGERIHAKIKKDSLSERLQKTRSYWQGWLNEGAAKLHNVDARYVEVVKKSLLVIKAHVDKRGGIIASCDSSIYNFGRDYYSYVWPRDGAFAIWPLIRLGYTEEAKKFFAFCRDILTPEGYLMHKYQPDRAIGSTWHPLLHGKRKELAIQEDETAIVIYMLGEYFHYSQDEDFTRSLYETLVKPAADFMSSFIDEQTGLPHASYDLWEMKFNTHTYTVAVVYQALLVAAEFAEKFDYPEDTLHWRQVAEKILNNSDVLFDEEQQSYRKGYLLSEGSDGGLEFENTIDVSSFYGVMMFNLYKDQSNLHKTVKAIETKLLGSTPAGGAPRFEHDRYFQADTRYLGNPWIITTLWLAQYYVRSKRLDKARHFVDWSLSHALHSGMLPEQVDPISGFALSVTPLVWSHAELINTVLDLAAAN